MKNLILNASCVDNETSNRPDTVIITLTSELAATLLLQMDNVNTLDLHAIEILSNNGVWLEGDEHSDQELLEKFTNDDCDELIQNMELHKIKIFSDFCRLYATPKHCGEAELCYSDRITKEQLLEVLAA